MSDGPIPRHLEVNEDTYTFHTPPNRWNDADLIAALTQLERLIPNLHAAYQQLATERDQRASAYQQLTDVLKDMT